MNASDFSIVEAGKLSAGHEKSIAIPFDWIYKTGICKDNKDIEKIFPVFTLLRKFRTDLSDRDIEFLKQHSSSIDELKLNL